jgi:hypothetical protein
MTKNRYLAKLPLALSGALVVGGIALASTYAVVTLPVGDAGTDAGNAQPIDDNHPAAVPLSSHRADDVTPEPRPEPGDDNGVVAEPADDKGGLRGGHGADDATPEPSASAESTSGRHGADDATPEPSASAEVTSGGHGADDTSPSPLASATADDHGGHGDG